MPNTDQLPHLIKLIEDDSEDVRQAVVSELSEFGPALKRKLDELDPPPTPSQRKKIQFLLQNQSRKRLRSLWPEWVELPDSCEKLEEGYRILSDYQTGYRYSDRLDELLDTLASNFQSAYDQPDVIDLSSYLFNEYSLEGNKNRYYHPLNSNPIHAIKQGKGLPITLAAIYKLTADRIGFRVEGCNFPGHFLARVYHDDRPIFVDCFNNGRQVDESFILNQNEDIENHDILHRMLHSKISADTWIRRVLNNLTRAYRKKEQHQSAQLMTMLLKFISRREDHGCDPLPITKEYFSTLDPRFYSGQIVNHRRGRFRGVIVDFDLNCLASESWYENNPPQPYRDQPWYTVLVDGTKEARYVAESMLTPDEGIDRVHHPKIEQYFNKFSNGIYIRNTRSWMGQRP